MSWGKVKIKTNAKITTKATTMPRSKAKAVPH